MKFFLRQTPELLRGLQALRPYLRLGRWRVAGVLGGMVATTLFESLGIGLLIPLLTLLIAGDHPPPMRSLAWLQGALPGRSGTFYILTLCGFVLAAILVKNAALYASQILAAGLRRRVQTNLRDALFARLHGADLHVFEQRAAGELTNIFLLDSVRVANTFDAIVTLAQRGCFAVFYVIALLCISWQLTLLTLVLGAVIAAAVSFLYARLAGSGAALTGANQRLTARLTETFAGVRVIRATDSQARERERFHALNAAQARVEETGARSSALLPPMVETIAVAGAMGIVGLGYSLLVRPGLLAPSYLLGFGFVLIRLLPLLNQLYALQGHLFFMAEGIRESLRWLATPGYPPTPFGEKKFRGLREAVRFERVSFQYANGRAALAEVSFELPAGKTVALVGASGSGKSTLAALLLRLRRPTGGRILVDGADAQEFSAESWHRAVAVVEQEAFLFHDSLRANIAYGLPGASERAVAEAARMAQLDDLLATLPDGLDTVVGERGAMLSGGQRQRLAIARALVRDPQILILDEATSALDNVSEAQVQAALSRAMEGRTTLVIAHRLSTIRHADEIIVLEAGRVAERGTWAELEGRAGLFGRFVAMGLPNV